MVEGTRETEIPFVKRVVVDYSCKTGTLGISSHEERINYLFINNSSKPCVRVTVREPQRGGEESQESLE